MQSKFPQIITALRKESGISQKKAALELGISQALLSHYEKGIRECGLDFLIRIADYYQVSCDYILGKTPDKSGAPVPTGEDSSGLAKRRELFHALSAMMEILQKIENPAVRTYAADYLSLAVYTVFRILHAPGGKSASSRFSVPEYLVLPMASGEMNCFAAKIRRLCEGREAEGNSGLTADDLPVLTRDRLKKDYPQFAESLFSVLDNAEHLLTDIS